MQMATWFFIKGRGTADIGGGVALPSRSAPVDR